MYISNIHTPHTCWLTSLGASRGRLMTMIYLMWGHFGRREKAVSMRSWSMTKIAASVWLRIKAMLPGSIVTPRGTWGPGRRESRSGKRDRGVVTSQKQTEQVQCCYCTATGKGENDKCDEQTYLYTSEPTNTFMEKKSRVWDVLLHGLIASPNFDCRLSLRESELKHGGWTLRAWPTHTLRMHHTTNRT